MNACIQATYQCILVIDAWELQVTYQCNSRQRWSGGLSVKCNRAIGVRIDHNNVFTLNKDWGGRVCRGQTRVYTCIHVDMRVNMWVDMCVDTSVNMWVDMRVSRHVDRHVYRHVHRHAYRRPHRPQQRLHIEQGLVRQGGRRVLRSAHADHWPSGSAL